VKTNTLGRILAPFWICILLVNCAAKTPPPPPPVVPQADGTYSITREAGTAFNRDTEKLKADVQEDATKFCAAQGKQLKVVSLTAEKPFFSTGYCKAKIVFKALAPGEAEVAEAVAGSTGATATAPRPSPTGDLYADLIKLDDLRKKGILTEEEFQSEKKKVLDRSK